MLTVNPVPSVSGDLPECARLSGNNDEVFDDGELQRALEDSSRDAKKQRQQSGKYEYN